MIQYSNECTNIATTIIGILSCNIGNTHTHSQASFHATLETLKPRPWVIDDLDAALHALQHPDKYQRKVIMLVDNAGSDVVLGMLPFARQFLATRPQCTVVLGANEHPSINDITASELEGLLDAASALLGAEDVLSQVRGIGGGMMVGA